MHTVATPWITAGVALASAGMIAVTPVSAPSPDVQLRDIQLTADINLEADGWAGLLGDTQANFTALLGDLTGPSAGVPASDLVSTGLLQSPVFSVLASTFLPPVQILTDLNAGDMGAVLTDVINWPAWSLNNLINGAPISCDVIGCFPPTFSYGLFTAASDLYHLGPVSSVIELVKGLLDSVGLAAVDPTAFLQAPLDILSMFLAI